MELEFTKGFRGLLSAQNSLMLRQGGTSMKGPGRRGEKTASSRSVLRYPWGVLVMVFFFIYRFSSEFFKSFSFDPKPFFSVAAHGMSEEPSFVEGRSCHAGRGRGTSPGRESSGRSSAGWSSFSRAP
jgi:hypothetical protein